MLKYQFMKILIVMLIQLDTTTTLLYCIFFYIIL